MSSQFNKELIADMARLETISIDEPFASDDNQRLFPFVAVGDREAHQQMIEGNMPLVITKVDKFLAGLPHLTYLRDDLTSAGFIGLTKAVDSIATGRCHNRNVTNYLSVSINREFRYLLENEMPIHISHSQRRRMKKEGKDTEVPSVGNNPPDCCRLPIAPQAQEVEARELICSCCKNETERKILRLRELGCTRKQVATRLSSSRTQVGRILDRIEADYHKKRDLRHTQEQSTSRGKKRSETRA